MKNKSEILGLEYTEDCRIHLCLYFLHGPIPKSADYKIMKSLCEYVNVIPVIGKV